MQKTHKEINENIIKNTKHLIKSREESKLSFSERSGVTRSTIYKILNGEVKKIQKSTVEKIADFFGVSVHLLEEEDIELIERTEVTYSQNSNPISVPIIDELDLPNEYTSTISNLIISKKQTFCYTKEKNVIAIKLQNAKGNYYDEGEILIVRRFFKGKNGELLVTMKNEKIEIKREIFASEILIGHIIEERKDE